MSRKALQPVTIAGIEFDALIDEQKNMSASVPTYPVEDGFPTSDAIILDPITIQMNLYVTNTPVTWLKKHGNSVDRVLMICNQIENMWLDKKTVKVVTTEAIYTNMGITSLSIKKSREIGYAREIAIQLQKISVTKRKTVTIPSYILKSGETLANGGAASSSNSSSKSSSSSTASSSSGSSSSSKESSNNAQKNQSILYGVASGFGFI